MDNIVTCLRVSNIINIFIYFDFDFILNLFFKFIYKTLGHYIIKYYY